MVRLKRKAKDGVLYGHWEINDKEVNIQEKVEKENQKTELFTIFEIEFVHENTGQVVNLTTTCGSYKELGKYLTEMSKKTWRMLKVTRKKN